MGIVLLLCYLGCSTTVQGSDEPQKISAGMLIDLMRNGSSVSLDNFTISEDLDLADPDVLTGGFTKEINSPMIINGSIFEGDFRIENHPPQSLTV